MDKPWLKSYDPHVTSSLSYPEISLSQLLEEAAHSFPEEVALIFFGNKIKYKTLQTHVQQFAQALASLGFSPGERLGIILPNMPHGIVSGLGAIKAGGVGVFFDPLQEAEEIKERINEARVEFLVILDLVWRRIKHIFPETKVRQFIVTGVVEYLSFPKNYFFQLAAKGRGIYVKVLPGPQIFPYADFLKIGQQLSSSQTEERANSAREAVIFFTKGTSGRAKGVVLTHKNLIANICQIRAWIGGLEKENGSFLSVAPFHRAYGFTLGMLLPIFLKAPIILFPHFEINQVLPLFKKHRPYFLPAHPTMIERFSTYLGLEKFHVQDIKICWSGEDVLQEEDRENFERKVGRKICETYGLTEAAALTHAQPILGKRKPGSIGLPLPDTEAKIIDPQSGQRELPVGEVGELIIKGPQVMKEYFSRPEITNLVLREGWLYTGDLARMDEEGYFYIVGRKGKR